MANKSKTSTQVKRRYNSKVYENVGAELPKEIVVPFKEKCKSLGISQASVLREAIEKFLEENK